MSVRFAPSPTGTFHIGNLRTAWISRELARRFCKKWILRFEDIDQPRVVAGSREKQIADMEVLGLRADRSYLQSDRRERHIFLFKEALRLRKIYPCFCSRKDVQDGIASAPHDSELPIYSGKCRNFENVDRGNNASVAWRFKGTNENGAGDFIIARTAGSEFDSASFVPAYHWACAIDDWDGEYDLIVRAWDLEESAKVQRLIQSWIAETEGKSPIFPAIFHTALITQNDGHRLEKRTWGVTLEELFARGYDSEEILNIFERSFSAEFDLVSGAISGEKSRVLSLRELGFG